jgi:Ni,Fe-hydrogenase III large subunit
MARAVVRWLETQRSLTFLREQLEEFRYQGSIGTLGASLPLAIAVSLVEGWRGEIVHVAVTGSAGELAGYEIFDPSFRNWFGLGLAMRGNQISDFPLCNKSFNLSYAGHDL